MEEIKWISQFLFTLLNILWDRMDVSSHLFCKILGGK